jgi:hypothetical protein
VTSILDRETEASAPPLDSEAPFRGDGERPDATGGVDVDVPDEVIPPPPLRPILAASLACTAAALVAGGIFGSWGARTLAMAAVFLGAGWAWMALRNPARESFFILSIGPVAFAVGSVLLIAAGGEGSRLPALLGEAVNSGRLLRPPVPFDPGWMPIVVFVFGVLGFGATWVATALERPRAAIGVPLPILALTAITQPDSGEFIAGLCAFVPLLAALAVLFGGDVTKASELGREFELKRALRAVAGGVAAVVALVVLSNASFLFPAPVYDPAESAQKPKPIPLSTIVDRVLFEVKTDSGITGPWKTGVLDVYDGEAFRLPPFDKKRLVAIPADGVVDRQRDTPDSKTVTVTLRDLGDAASIPALSSPTRVETGPGLDVRYDPRTNVFRLPEGRAPADVSYTVAQPIYPDAAALSRAPALEDTSELSDTLEMPKPPARISRLLQEAPPAPAWDRLAYVRKALRDVVVAAGGGAPGDVPPERVVEILDSPTHEASPYEIVAAETMLARWAGIPARIGFGFDGLNDEGGVFTVRPANAAQWLEVYFEGHGWVPLIEAPKQAKSDLDEDTKVDPDIVASDEIAAEVLIPIKLESFKQLYQKVREQLVALLPYAAVLLALYLANPAVMRVLRRRKRRKWAEGVGLRAQIAVEYAEFRDAAHDMNLGDPLDTPLEYLARVEEDAEHQELAWLVSRALYGDLSRMVTDADAQAAEELAASLRRRMTKAQPFQVKALAMVSKASLRDPYTDEVPTIALLDPLGRWSRWRTARRLERRGRRRTSRRRLFGLVPNLTSRRS